MVIKIHNKKQLKERRRALRSGKTPAEAALWKCLQKSQLGEKFRRQHSIGDYVVDFYCAECRLAIELDGDRHYQIDVAAADVERTTALSKFSVRVLRFENRQVFENLDLVVEEIKRNLFTTPVPS